MTESTAVLQIKLDQLTRERDETLDLLARSWVPIRKRARVLTPGNLIVDQFAGLWSVSAVSVTALDVKMVIIGVGSQRVHERTVKPDKVFDVLVTRPDRDALLVARELLGAQMIAPG